MVVADFQFFRDVGQKSVQKVIQLKYLIEKSNFTYNFLTFDKPSTIMIVFIKCAYFYFLQTHWKLFFVDSKILLLEYTVLTSKTTKLFVFKKGIFGFFVQPTNLLLTSWPHPHWFNSHRTKYWRTQITLFRVCSDWNYK
jgi:hypothetical protein